MFGLQHDDRENRDTNKPIETDYACILLCFALLRFLSLFLWIVYVFVASLLDDVTINGGNDYTVWCDTLVGDFEQFVSIEKFDANAHTITRKIETTKANPSTEYQIHQMTEMKQVKAKENFVQQDRNEKNERHSRDAKLCAVHSSRVEKRILHRRATKRQMMKKMNRLLEMWLDRL